MCGLGLPGLQLLLLNCTCRSLMGTAHSLFPASASQAGLASQYPPRQLGHPHTMQAPPSGLRMSAASSMTEFGGGHQAQLAAPLQELRAASCHGSRDSLSLSVTSVDSLSSKRGTSERRHCSDPAEIMLTHKRSEPGLARSASGALALQRDAASLANSPGSGI